MAASVLSMGPITIGSTTIAARQTTIDPAIASSLQMHSGLQYPALQVVPGANPRVTFTCYFQDIFALTGLTILSATTFTVYQSLYASFIRSASAVHTAFALASACTAAVQILSVRTEQDGTLMADCEAVLLSSDGTTNPIAITTNNSLPALSAAAIMHTLGPCVINGTGIPGVMSAGLDLNPTLEVKRSDGDLYPRIAGQLQGQPKLTVGHGDPKGVLAALSILGASLSSSCIQYFRRYDATTGVAGSSNGVSFTIASGRAQPVAIMNEQGKISSTGIEVSGLSTSTTHPVVTSTSATVPASG
jgi:hypothetical protein